MDLEEIRPKSTMKSSKNDKTKVDSNEVFLNEYKLDSIDLKLARIISLNNESFLNRFPSKKNTLRTLFLTDTIVQIQHEHYEYVDSNQMKNAFFNWLDCYGIECRSIKLYEETKIEPENLLFIAAEKSIDIFRSKSSYKPEDWINFVRFSIKNNEFKFILFQKKNRKAQWFEFKNYQLIPKKKK
ncbi:MAG: hypothetical protein FJZ67_09335 [Bacteroidetes bacterium]|nr:hypothetical protein [Bacteroidota bacterium]